MTVFIDNKYAKAYDAIINRRRADPATEYIERHHVLPKSLGGSDDSSNLVAVTMREHFICHKLLVKMTTGYAKHQMVIALKATIMNSPARGKYFTSREYQRLRDSFKQAMRLVMVGKNVGKKRTEEQKLAISLKSTGRYHTEESKQLMSEKRLQRETQPWTGKEHAPETKARISAGNKGKIRSAEQRDRLATLRVGKAPWNKGLSLEEQRQYKASKS